MVDEGNILSQSVSSASSTTALSVRPLAAAGGCDEESEVSPILSPQSTIKQEAIPLTPDDRQVSVGGLFYHTG